MDAVYEFIFRNAAEGILIIDADGRLLHLNPAATSMLGLGSERVIGEDATHVLAAFPALLRLATRGGAWQLDVRLHNGRLATGVAGTLHNQRVIILNDITEKRDLEARREALIKAITHDLRNPLNALAGYADLVEKLGDLTPQQAKYSARIQQTVNKLYELSGKLIDLSWIEAGMPLEHMPVELASLTRAVIDQLAGLEQRHEVIIVNSMPDSLPTVLGDAGRLQQTIYNVLDNAIRYSFPGGTVVIHAWHQDTDVFYTIADKGIGIAKDELPLIWDRMWRSVDERIRDIPGGGVGLAFAQTIIKRHGGQIWAESTLDAGTTVGFRLPVAAGG